MLNVAYHNYCDHEKFWNYSKIWHVTHFGKCRTSGCVCLVSVLGIYEGPTQGDLYELMWFLGNSYVFKQVGKLWDKLVIRENMRSGDLVELK